MQFIILLCFLMTGYSISQYLKYRQTSRLMSAGFWLSFLALRASSIPLFAVLTIIFLCLTCYFKFIKKDYMIKSMADILREHDPDVDLWKKEEVDHLIKDLAVPEKEKKEEITVAEIYTPVKDFTDILIQNPHELVYPTNTDKDLVIPSGVLKISIRMEFRPDRCMPKDEIDVTIFFLRLHSPDGQLWECKLFLLPYIFTDPFESEENPPSSGFIYWKEAPEIWKKAMEDHCLIAGVINLLDSRGRYDLKIGENLHTIMLKYQGPSIDVAYLAESSSFIIRISQMYHEIWEGEKWIDTEEMPSFCFKLSQEGVLFLFNPKYYYINTEMWYDYEEDEDSKKPFEFYMVDD